MLLIAAAETAVEEFVFVVVFVVVVDVEVGIVQTARVAG